MKKNMALILCFVLECVFTLLSMFLHPTIRTCVMSFFKMVVITVDVATWWFYGVEN